MSCKDTSLSGFVMNPILFLGQETHSCLEVMLTHQGLGTDVKIWGIPVAWNRNNEIVPRHHLFPCACELSFLGKMNNLGWSNTFRNNSRRQFIQLPWSIMNGASLSQRKTEGIWPPALPNQGELVQPCNRQRQRFGAALPGDHTWSTGAGWEHWGPTDAVSMGLAGTCQQWDAAVPAYQEPTSSPCLEPCAAPASHFLPVNACFILPPFTCQSVLV